MGNPGLIPGLGRSAGEGKSYSLQYSGLENSMDRGAWQVPGHSPWGCTELDMTERLSLSKKIIHIKRITAIAMKCEWGKRFKI